MAARLQHRVGVGAWHERLGPASDEASGFGAAYSVGSRPWPTRPHVESPVGSNRVFDSTLSSGSRRGTPGTSPVRPATLPQGEGAGAGIGAGAASVLGSVGSVSSAAGSHMGRHVGAGALELWREPQAVPITRVVEVFREARGASPQRGVSPAMRSVRGEAPPRQASAPPLWGSASHVRGVSPDAPVDLVSCKLPEPDAMHTAGLQRLGRLEDGLVTIRNDLAELCGRRAAGRRERVQAELRDLRPACEELARAKALAQMAADRNNKIVIGCEELQRAQSSALSVLVEPGAECGAGGATSSVVAGTWAGSPQLVARERARQERLDRLEDQLQRLLPLEVQLPRAREELEAAEARARRSREELDVAEQMAARSEVTRGSTKLELDHVRGELVRVDGELRWHRDELERVRSELKNARAECQVLQCQSAGTSEDALKIDRLESELHRLRPMERQLLQTTEELEKAMEETRRSQAELARTREQLSEFSMAEVEWAQVRDELARAREELARRNFDRVRETNGPMSPADMATVAAASGALAPSAPGGDANHPVDDLSRAREELARAEAERTRVREDRAAAAAAFLAEVELQDAAAMALDKESWTVSGAPPLPMQLPPQRSATPVSRAPPLPQQSSAAWRVLAGSPASGPGSAAGACTAAGYDGYDALSGSEESITPSQSASRSNSPHPPKVPVRPGGVTASNMFEIGLQQRDGVRAAGAPLPDVTAKHNKGIGSAMPVEELSDFLPWDADGSPSEDGSLPASDALQEHAAFAAAPVATEQQMTNDTPAAPFPAATAQATGTASAPSTRSVRMTSAAAADWASPAQTGSSLEGWTAAPTAPASASTAASAGWAETEAKEKVSEDADDFCPWARQETGAGQEATTASFLPWDDSTGRSSWPEAQAGASTSTAPVDKQITAKPMLDGILPARGVSQQSSSKRSFDTSRSPGLNPVPPPPMELQSSPSSNLTVFGSVGNFSPTNPFCNFPSPGDAGFVANPKPGFAKTNPFAN